MAGKRDDGSYIETIKRIFTDDINSAVHRAIFDPALGHLEGVEEVAHAPTKFTQRHSQVRHPWAWQLIAANELWEEYRAFMMRCTSTPVRLVRRCRLMGAGCETDERQARFCGTWQLCPWCRYRLARKLILALLEKFTAYGSALQIVALEGGVTAEEVELLRVRSHEFHQGTRDREFVAGFYIAVPVFLEKRQVAYRYAVVFLKRPAISLLVLRPNEKFLNERVQRATRQGIIDAVARALRYEVEIAKSFHLDPWMKLISGTWRMRMLRLSHGLLPVKKTAFKSSSSIVGKKTLEDLLPI